jgi:hypothetical protein
MFERISDSAVVVILLVAACGAGTNSKSQDMLGAGGSGGAQAPSSTGSVGVMSGGSGTGSGGGGQPASNMGAGGSGVTQAPPATADASTNPRDAGSTDAATAPDAGADAGNACDRACLLDVMQSYLDALIAQDPSKAKFAADAKYTANGVTAQLGEGLWKTATSLVADERMDFGDPEAGQVGSQVVVQEGSSPVIYQVRLKVVAHEITEIETMEVRQADAANGFFSPADMKPQPVFSQAIDPAKRMTRDQLKAEVDLYIMYLDGQVAGSGVHFDDNCARYENGFQTASGLSSFNLQSWSFDVVARYLVFDEEAGLVWGMFPFTHDPSTLVVGELFKVIDGKIMMIQAVMANMPANAWD